jgi:hypothetical protein
MRCGVGGTYFMQGPSAYDEQKECPAKSHKTAADLYLVFSEQTSRTLESETLVDTFTRSDPLPR